MIAADQTRAAKCFHRPLERRSQMDTLVAIRPMIIDTVRRMLAPEVETYEQGAQCAAALLART